MEHVEGGKADLSIIHSVCQQLKDHNTKSIVIIKSTVPIGTTVILQEKYGLRIIHNPEFLTARNADIDFITPARTILGGDKELTYLVSKLFSERFPGTNIFEMTSNESEAVKYIANCFFAVKVMYFNEMFLGLKDAFDLDWNKVMSGVLTDGRIGISHCDVPGHDGKLGIGGACFPKDICALIHQIEGANFDPKLLKAAWEQNKAVRPEMDWGRIPSAVSSSICTE
jgi:UDPglucose 6-dehydrogenase